MPVKRVDPIRTDRMSGWQLLVAWGVCALVLLGTLGGWVVYWESTVDWYLNDAPPVALEDGGPEVARLEGRDVRSQDLVLVSFDGVEFSEDDVLPRRRPGTEVAAVLHDEAGTKSVDLVYASDNARRLERLFGVPLRFSGAVQIAVDALIALPVVLCALLPLVLAPRRRISALNFIVFSSGLMLFRKLDGGFNSEDLPVWLLLPELVSLTAMMVYPAWFPDGRLRPRATWVKAVTAFLVAWGAGRLFGALPSALGLVAIVGTLSLYVDLALRYRRELDAEERQQVRWAGVGMAFPAMLFAVMLLWSLLGVGLMGWSAPPADLVNPAFNASMAVFAVFLTTAALRYRLWDLPLAASSGVVLTLLAAVFLGFDFALNQISNLAIVEGLGLSGAGADFATWAVAGVGTAAVAGPLRAQASRRLAPAHSAAREVLAEAGPSLARCADLEAIVDHVRDVLRRAWQVDAEVHLAGETPIGALYPAAEGALAAGETVELAADDPRHVGVLLVPVCGREGLVAVLVLPPRSPWKGYGAADLELMSDWLERAAASIEREASRNR